MKTHHGDYQEVLRFPVWSGYRVYVVFTEDIAKSRMARYGTVGNAPGADALFTRGAGGYGHLFYKPAAAAGVIAHEAWHALWAMFKWAGVKKWDNETVAYHLGYLVGTVSRFQAKVLKRRLGNKYPKSHKA
jgi:hypothetical protein